MARWHCGCTKQHTDPQRVVLTGGPGAGKTAVLGIIHHHFCQHVVVLPEAASIIFGGGFPRRPSVASRMAAQRAIFRVQLELERLALEEKTAAIVLCDRGTLDGAAYWPGDPASFFASNATTLEAEESPATAQSSTSGRPLQTKATITRTPSASSPRARRRTSTRRS